jgi:hypothetical protein
VAWFVLRPARVQDGLEAVEPAAGDSGEARGDLNPVAGAPGFLTEGDGGEGLPVPREPGSAASAATMAKRSRRAVSEGQEARSERPTTGRGQTRIDAKQGGTD